MKLMMNRSVMGVTIVKRTLPVLATMALICLVGRTQEGRVPGGPCDKHPVGYQPVSVGGCVWVPVVGTDGQTNGWTCSGTCIRWNYTAACGICRGDRDNYGDCQGHTSNPTVVSAEKATLACTTTNPQGQAPHPPPPPLPPYTECGCPITGWPTTPPGCTNVNMTCDCS
jgi:hypothetical protein